MASRRWRFSAKEAVIKAQVLTPGWLIRAAQHARHTATLVCSALATESSRWAHALRVAKALAPGRWSRSAFEPASARPAALEIGPHAAGADAKAAIDRVPS